MKTILHYFKLNATILFSLISIVAFSQEGINYQGVARDVNNDLLANANIKLDINIIENAPGGTPVYSETHEIMTDINGVFSIVIGQGTPTLNVFTDINWAEDKHFFNVFLDGIEIGTTEFTSVPYTQAMGKWQSHKNGVTTKGTGGSIYVGDNAGESDDFTDNKNIGIGFESLKNIESGDNNIALGNQSLFTNSLGHRNIGLGAQTLFNNRSGEDNIAVGLQSLYNNTIGNNNIANGIFSLYNNTTGNNNIGLGVFALLENTTGENNVGIGYKPLNKNTIGSNNIALGYNALYNNNANGNIAIGSTALENNLTGTSNIAIGTSSLNANSSGQFNIGLGAFSLNKNTEGFYNIALGYAALADNTTGNNNIANGHYALYNNTSGTSNTAFGNAALYSNTIGHNNFAVGFRALWKNTEGTYNTAIGNSTLYQNTTGSSNIAIGYHSLYSSTTGEHNIANGFESLFSNTTGSNNIANGYQAMRSNTFGEYNIASGFNALYSNTSGNNNIALGQNTLKNNTTGWGNIALGLSALEVNTDVSNIAIGTGVLKDHSSGYGSVGLGAFALNHHTSGEGNVAIGSSSLDDNLTGVFNTAIGYRSGGDTLGDKNVFIGAFSGTHSDFENVSNTLIIDNVTTNNPLIYGEFENNILSFGAKVGIGTKTPAIPLQITSGNDANLSNGTGQILIGPETGFNLVMDANEIQARNAGAASDLYLQNDGGNVRVGGAIVHASDRRLKRDIEDISFGLKEVLQLEPKEYFWKGKEQDNKSLGLIAQDVNEVIKNVVTYNADEDKYGVSYTELIPVLIKAIKEQQEIIESQKVQFEVLNKNINALDERLKKVEHLKIAIN